MPSQYDACQQYLMLTPDQEAIYRMANSMEYQSENNQINKFCIK